MQERFLKSKQGANFATWEANQGLEQVDWGAQGDKLWARNEDFWFRNCHGGTEKQVDRWTQCQIEGAQKEQRFGEWSFQKIRITLEKVWPRVYQYETSSREAIRTQLR